MQKGCAAAYEPFNMNIYDGVRFLLVQVMDDLVMSGRANRTHDLSTALLEDPNRREKVRRWPTRGGGKKTSMKGNAI